METRPFGSGKENQTDADDEDKAQDDLLEKAGGDTFVEEIAQKAPDDHNRNHPAHEQFRSHLPAQGKVYVKADILVKKRNYKSRRLCHLQEADGKSRDDAEAGDCGILII
jgi:hypothetical protein